MMTRKALTRQEESKLQLALSELKVSKELCDQLNRERDDNERELLESLDKHQRLKNEMTQLHGQYTDAIDARDRLQHIVDRFDHCSSEYDQALNYIQELKKQLHEANNKIVVLETSKHNKTASLNQSLFDELVVCAPSLVSATASSQPTVTVDLTCDVSRNSNNFVKIAGCSKNKLKKYIKINKYITKTQKLVKKHKFFIKNVKLNRERLYLIDKLDIYSSQLHNKNLQYKNDTQLLQNSIEQLQDSLLSITKKYELSQSQIKEHMLAMNELVEMCNENNDTSNHTSKCKQLPGHLSVTCESSSPIKLVNANVPKGSLIQCKIINTPHLIENINKEDLDLDNKNDIVIFSDEFGKNMGRLLFDLGHSIINYCMPGASYHDILTKAIDYKYKPNSTLLIFVGNRGKLNKSSLIKSLNNLNNLNVGKIILFTLPYCNSLPQEENTTRHKLNLTLHTFCNNENLHLIDTNNYVRNFYLTKDNYYLPIYFKRQIASSLSYFIHISAKNLAKQVAPIEQCLIDINVSSVSTDIPINNLN